MLKENGFMNQSQYSQWLKEKESYEIEIKYLHEKLHKRNIQIKRLQGVFEQAMKEIDKLKCPACNNKDIIRKCPNCLHSW